jgi:hypothetical protein
VYVIHTPSVTILGLRRIFRYRIYGYCHETKYVHTDRPCHNVAPQQRSTRHAASRVTNYREGSGSTSEDDVTADESEDDEDHGVKDAQFDAEKYIPLPPPRARQRQEGPEASLFYNPLIISCRANIQAGTWGGSRAQTGRQREAREHIGRVEVHQYACMTLCNGLK